jgi:hypothetical protein
MEHAVMYVSGHDAYHPGFLIVDAD